MMRDLRRWLTGMMVVAVCTAAAARSHGDPGSGASPATGAGQGAPGVSGAPGAAATPAKDSDQPRAGGAAEGKKVASRVPPPPRFTMPGTDRKVQFPTGLYDEKADAAADIRAAIARARQSNKRVLVMWGENQCGFCAYLSDLIWYESAGCRTLLDNEYEFVKVDILSPPAPGQQKGAFGKNMDVARKYGATDTALMSDAPRLTIIDPVNDRGVQTLAGSQMTAKPMSMERVFDEQVILPFLANNIAPAKPAFDVIDAAAKKALYEEKAVLVLFGAPEAGCEACALWSVWFGRSDVSQALGKAFVVAYVDAERMTGGRSLMERLSGSGSANPPVVVALTDRGKAFEPPVVCAKFPATTEEVSALLASLARAGGTKLGEAEREALRKSLQEK